VPIGVATRAAFGHVDDAASLVQPEGAEGNCPALVAAMVLPLPSYLARWRRGRGMPVNLPEGRVRTRGSSSHTPSCKHLRMEIGRTCWACLPDAAGAVQMKAPAGDAVAAMAHLSEACPDEGEVAYRKAVLRVSPEADRRLPSRHWLLPVKRPARSTGLAIPLAR